MNLRETLEQLASHAQAVLKFADAVPVNPGVPWPYSGLREFEDKGQQEAADKYETALRNKRNDILEAALDTWLKLYPDSPLSLLPRRLLSSGPPA